MSKTIQELHNLVSINETQQGASDRITGVEIRNVDNAVIDELAVRGAVQMASTSLLASLSKSESNNVVIPGDGGFAIIASIAAPDNVNTFASSQVGWLWQRVSNFAAASLVRPMFASDNGIVYDSTTGTFSLGEVRDISPINPQAQLQSDREIMLNGFNLFFKQITTGNRYVFIGTGGNPMLGIDTSSTDDLPTGKPAVYSIAVRKYQAGATIHAWMHNFRGLYPINGNVTMFTAENEHSNTWVDTEFTNSTGYPGGQINIPSGNGYSNLMVEMGFTGTFAGSTIGLIYNIGTRLKCTALGGITVDKFIHININVEHQIRANTVVNEHYGIYVNPLKTSPNTKAYSFYAASPDDIMLIGGTFELITPKTPANSAAAGDTGTVAWDENFIYIKTATGGWKRAAIAVF